MSAADAVPTANVPVADPGQLRPDAAVPDRVLRDSASPANPVSPKTGPASKAASVPGS
jgi:hypothetical protein